MMHRVLSPCLLVAALMAAGCSKDEPPAPSPTPAANTESGDHAHGAGPHGGAVTDWGGGTYHVEFIVNHPTKQATVYVLGDDGKSPAPVKAEKLLLSINEPAFQVELMPQPLDGEAEGMSSRFVGQHDNLDIVQEFGGTISGEVDGQPFAGDFQEKP